MKVEVSLGEVVDKISILTLKVRKLHGEALQNVQREHDGLRSAWQQGGLPSLEELPEWDPLCRVNAALWEVEDALRNHEARGDFGQEFVARARSVYRLNDERAALKRTLNLRLGSTLIEEKSY